MRTVALVVFRLFLLLLLLPLGLVSGCSTTSGGAETTGATIPAHAAWEGRIADRYYNAAEPATPALRPLTGSPPIVYLTRAAPAGALAEAAYELAVFDDGTFVYEGHRCVRVGGILVTRLSADALSKIQGLLAASCVDLAGLNDGELCDDAATVRVRCASGSRVESGSDHCRKREPAGRRIESLHADLVESLGLAMFVGEPAERQACAYAARDLAPHDLARVVFATGAPVNP
jgi:hypothetical protein